MLKSLILFTLVLNIAFAKDRFSADDKKRFLDDVKQEIAEHKVENKGRVDLQIIKPGLYAELEEFLKQEKFTREEMVKIKQDYENLAKDTSITSDKAEQAFYDFLNKELDAINSKSLEKVKEGNVCNNWSCEDGLKCAPDPVQAAIGKLKKAGSTCAESSECVSNECVEATPGSKNKICEDVYRCFRPLSVGESCMANPVCGQGSCLPYNSLTSGIGECNVQGASCKKNSDCCTNSCDAGMCKSNFICKDCIQKGAKPQRGQKCCEGLYQNGSGMCVPDVVPYVGPKVYVAPPVKSIFVGIENFFLSSAVAEDTTAATTTTAASADDEAADIFLNTGAVNDNKDLKGEINGNKTKYENFQQSSREDKSLNMTAKPANIVYKRRSNFETCDIYFKDDFYNEMKAKGTLNLETAMLGFDFVTTGDSDNDYWTVSGQADSSLYSRLKAVGVSHRAIRAKMNKDIDVMNKQLTCACLDVKGYNQITDEAKKKLFADTCPEYEKYTNPAANFDELDGDASGLKAKRMLAIWSQDILAFEASLLVDNTSTYTGLKAVDSWANEKAKWHQATVENFDLFKFSIKGSSSSVAGLGGLVGALLAAGVIAILGGFATTSILSAWAAAGIIAASAATGAGGLWMIASLKGAWLTQRPEINDYHVAPRSYSCGKKQTCMEYTRTLVQPVNEVCNIHTSSEACIKAFVVVNEGTESRYIVDPWIPFGVSKDAILKGQPNYADKMEEGFKAAKSAMINKNPGATGGGGKKGGGSFVTQSYLSEVFIDATVVGRYVPQLGADLQGTYFLNADRVKLIKEAAKAFAISEGFIEASDTDSLTEFAEYAYAYHFLWPKKANFGEIAYPTAGLLTYLDYMTNDVAFGISALSKEGVGDSKTGALALAKNYLQDYKNALVLYASKPTNQSDALKTALLSKEIDKTQKALDNLLTIGSMLDNSNLDTQLSTLSSGFIAAQSKSAGASATANFSSSELSFVKAVGTLRTARKAQLKALDQYTKAMAASGDKDRTAKMATVTRNFGNTFTNKSGSAMGSSAGTSSSGSANAVSDKNDKSSSLNSNSSSYGSGTGALYGSGARGSSGSGSTASGSDASKNGDATAAAGTTSEDEKRLADAIAARDQAKKDKYQSNEGQTLFEKVTNAYIRNYDKVLSKKKDKDVIEDKQ